MVDTVISIRIGGSSTAYESEIRLGTAAAVRAVFQLERHDGTVVARAISTLESGYYANDDLKYLGAQLWDALLPGALAAEARKLIQDSDLTLLRLEVPPELEILPWEAVWDDHLRYLACHPKVCMVHSPPQRSAPPPRGTPADSLAILVVIPQGSGLDSATEWANLKASVAKLADAVSLVDLRGIVTPDKLSEALARQHWHVVHFIGHGRLAGDTVEIRLNDEQGGESWRGADEIVTMFAGAKVDVCVLNCCHGGTSADIKTTERIAPALVDAGVRGVVAMRYAMVDTAANRFAQVFYDQLLRGARLGHVAYAAQLARKSLLQNVAPDDHRSFITPLVYQNAPSDVLFQLTSPSRPSVAAVAVARQPQAGLAPQALINAIRKRSCLLVVGPLLSPPLQRREGPPQGLRGLIEHLRNLAMAEPGIDEDPIDAFPDDWPLEAQLARIAERFEVANAWALMVGAIRDYYSAAQPSELHRLIASWRSPGIFHTHFDGLMEAAHACDYRVRVVRKLTESPDATGTAGSGDSDASSLLVLVRGSLSDPTTLILNEHDHFLLSEQIDRIHSSITALRKGHFDRRILFLGCAPGDQVVRELARKLLEANNPRATESFFVSMSHLPSDERFWHRFRVSFLRTETEALIRALSANSEQA